VEVSPAGFLSNPLAPALKEQRLTNRLVQHDQTTGIFLQTGAESDFPTGIGSMRFSVTGVALTISCVSGKLEFQSLKTDGCHSIAQINVQTVGARKQADEPATLQFARPVSLAAGQTLTLE
jgi:hypothetical protein